METHTKIIKSGFLHKAPPVDKLLAGRWKVRFFTLQEESFRQQISDPFTLNVVLYYSSRKGNRKGEISLADCDEISFCKTARDGFNYAMELRCPERKITFYLAAASMAERQEWLAVLRYQLSESKKRMQDGQCVSGVKTVESLRRDSLKRYSVTDSGYEEGSDFYPVNNSKSSICSRTLPPVPEPQPRSRLLSDTSSHSSASSSESTKHVEEICEVYHGPPPPPYPSPLGHLYDEPTIPRASSLGQHPIAVEHEDGVYVDMNSLSGSMADLARIWCERDGKGSETWQGSHPGGVSSSPCEGAGAIPDENLHGSSNGDVSPCVQVSLDDRLEPEVQTVILRLSAEVKGEDVSWL